MGVEELEKLSKGAFDVTKHGEAHDWFTTLQEGFQLGLNNLMIKFGVTEEDYKNVVAYGSRVLDTVAEKGGMEAFSASAGMAVRYGLKSIGYGTLSGPFGVAVSTLVEVAGNIWKTSKGQVTIGQGGVVFGEGEWVGIDNGALPRVPEETMKRREQHRELQEVESRDLNAVTRDVSTGFYIGEGAEQNYVRVFNFKTLREEEQFVFNVARLGPADSSKMDGDSFAAEVRKLHFVEGPGPTTGSDVCLDPGAEVIFNNTAYNVVKSVGAQVVIEDAHGRRIFVDLKKLRRGRVTNTTSYNYSTEGQVNTGFTSPGESAIYSGQYVWVSARENIPSAQELVAVQYIRGDRVVGFYALDGEQGDWLELGVGLVDDELTQTLSATRVFAEFREFAMAGHDMKRVAPGSQYPRLCIGATNTPITKQRQFAETAGVVPGTANEFPMTTVGDSGLKEALDEAHIRGQLVSGIPQDEVDAIFEETESTGTNLIPILVLVAGGIFLFNSFG